MSDTYNYQQNLQKLMDLRQKTINERNLMILQTDDTFHRNNVKSRIDHIYTNTVGKINNLQNIKTLFSDHSLLVFNYKTKSKVLSPKFAWKRDKFLLTKHTLSQYFQNNLNINTIFNYTDPNIYIYDLFIPFGTLYMIVMGEYNTVSTI